MSALSEVNLKQGLRKLEYPLCAKEALNKIVELICGRITSIKNMDLALDLMAEFIFCEVDRRGHKKQQSLSPLLELQLIEISHNFFNSIQSETARNTVFLSLFSGTTVTVRLGILSRLVSVAVGIPSSTILTATSVWMQQLGNASPNSCKLSEALIQDYFFYYQNSTERLKSLPSVCPQFVANFLTAVSEIYFSTSKKELQFPPKILLETITSWIVGNSNLCIAAQLKQAILPPGAIAMEAITPIAGLLKWCILAPIFKQNDEIYAQLHLALLNSAVDGPGKTSSKVSMDSIFSFFRGSIKLQKGTFLPSKATFQPHNFNSILSCIIFAFSLLIANYKP
ncbi:unnamed protein product [Acanthoscelides obtectus]|uniref:Uncharacterized protein n=1 Tax=Acanthoscelides obtectus TaxID=200917 RepID=A0A9P0LDI7_ACAOB|nr:unnamed protein product [Acanthoscelides obtectus]CAK1655212.1 Uncharacterized protein C7orf26 [Acanthoscelides obtectus]